MLGYAIEYASEGLPGILGQLRPLTIAGTALILSGLLVLLARRRSIPKSPAPVKVPWVPAVIAASVIAFLLAFMQSQASLPVIPNDALTYHFPAAAQWLQHQRIDLYQTWFFNPANTYSPLAGSTFIVWLIAPFGNDLLARFVEVPALLCVGLAVYRLNRQLGVGTLIATVTAAAAILCRPMFLQSMMGKDDLFLAFFFIATLVALAPDRRAEKFRMARIGIALGLLLATKYTAFLAAPILLLALFSSPGRKAGHRTEKSAFCNPIPGLPAWAIKDLVIVLAFSMLMAGPWYLRNWYLTGNPIFPLDGSILGIHMFHGLFTTSVSDGLRPITAATSVVVGGSYGLPTSVAVFLAVGWIAATFVGFRSLRSSPSLRVCVIGPILGLAIFFWKSPFPEVRFVVPEFLLLFAATGFAIDRVGRPAVASEAANPGWGRIVLASLLLAISLVTIFVSRLWLVVAPFAGVAIAVAVCVAVVLRLNRRLQLSIAGVCAALFIGYAYTQWTAYCHACQMTLHAPGSGYDQNYPAEEQLWRFVDQHVPADTTIAYADLYLTYPLYGFNLQRRVVYAPTRPGVRSIADLPWLGERLSGEHLVPAAVRATEALADRNVWLDNLKAARAEYLVIGSERAPETTFARNDPKQFRLIYEGPGGLVFVINQKSQSHPA